jgi:carboxymethylenebutenolidase
MPAVKVTGTTSAPALDAYLATPAVGAGPWPGVVVLHEAFGLNEDIRDHADRLAAAGYLAVAPDLYTAGGAIRCLKGVFGAMMAGQGPAVDDIMAVRRWLVDRPDCTGHIGVIGFCLGGGFALLTSTLGFEAAAPNYGILPPETEKALSGACPIVASYGQRDRMLRGTPEKIETALTQAGIPHDVKSYPGVGHSFLNRHSMGVLNPLIRVVGFNYDRSTSEDAWRRVLTFFAEHLEPAA